MADADSDRSRLERECAVFRQYLVPGASNEGLDYVTRHYVRAHERGSVTAGVEPSAVERRLVAIAAKHRGLTSLADAFASLFARSSLLRRKLVLLLAILETSAPGHRQVDTVTPGSKAGFFVALALRGVTFGLRAAAALALLGPVLLIARLSGRREPAVAR